MEQKKTFGKYYLGLDMGTESVGWAVTDMDYQVMKFNGKAMWGSRLFPEAQSAADRRVHRIARRRIQRRNQRLALLQDLLKDEICKIDPNFFVRLQEGMLHAEDKSTGDKNNLFAGSDYTDKEYHKQYPTIYHLRSELLHSQAPHDVRLVYLALHHILKYRGHFLFEGSMEGEGSFDSILTDLVKEIESVYETSVQLEDTAQIKEVLCDRNMGKSYKQKALNGLIICQNKSVTALVKAISGSSVKLKDLFDVEGEENQKIAIEFGSDKYDENLPTLEALLGDDYFVLAKAKALHDWAILENILHGYDYLSDAKVGLYQQHAADLKTLKKLICVYAKDAYDAVFKDPSGKHNYCAYAGVAKVKGKKVNVEKRCSQADFCKYLKDVLKNAKVSSEYEDAMKRIETNEFLPKLRTKDNSVVPNQIHAKEMAVILENAAHYLHFLRETDENGLTIIDKINQILTFRIPYYVGPLYVDKSKRFNAWAERRSREKIYPWNFDEIIDREVSAESFISRMTAQCTYLKDCTVLPQNSLLYSKFTVLNELNNICINGEPIPVSLKQDIYTDYFLTHTRATLAGMITYLKCKGIVVTKDQITGIEGDFHTSLRPWKEMKDLLGTYFREDVAETIIRLSTVLGDDKKMYQQKLKKELGKVLPPELILKATMKRFKGWGRLSGEFLTTVRDNIPSLETGEFRNIITSMWETNENLMQLLSRNHGFVEKIREHNQSLDEAEGYTYAQVKDLYVSPAVKRSIWQTLSVVKEIRKITGHDPEKVFVEVARGGGEKGKRTESRKQNLLNLYKTCKEDSRDWIGEISARDDADYRSDRLYLYYTQMGRCMYTGHAIDLDKLFDATVYDVDHIYPQSKVKDDSIDNRVLVERVSNAEKTDIYPIEKEIRDQRHGLWSMLYTKGLISKKKYERLTRGTPLTMDELTDFVARQLVETRQGTKAIAEILQKNMPESEIVYVKAGLVSDFRKDYSMLKCREVNDMHHGKDAYLNIVVGNVYNTKFTRDPRNFFKEPNHEYSLRQMFNYDVKRGTTVAWIKGDAGSIVTVRRMMQKNNVLVTKMVVDQKGKLFNTMLVKKNAWQMPMKQGKACFTDSTKYGGYKSVTGAYFMLVEHTTKGKRVRSLIDMPLHLSTFDPTSDVVNRMLVNEKGLLDPVVLMKHIGMNSVIDIDGFRMHITGRSDSHLLYAPAEQLVIGNVQEMYIRNLCKVVERANEFAKIHPKQIMPIRETDRVSADQNVKLFDSFVQKLESSHYSVRLKEQVKNLTRTRERFKDLSELEQCRVLLQILNMFTCNSQMADLRILGLGERSGGIKTQNCVTNYKKAEIIHYSVTGLFEKKLDLLK